MSNREVDTLALCACSLAVLLAALQRLSHTPFTCVTLMTILCLVPILQSPNLTITVARPRSSLGDTLVSVKLVFRGCGEAALAAGDAVSIDAGAWHLRLREGGSSLASAAIRYCLLDSLVLSLPLTLTLICTPSRNCQCSHGLATAHRDAAPPRRPRAPARTPYTPHHLRGALSSPWRRRPHRRADDDARRARARPHAARADAVVPPSGVRGGQPRRAPQPRPRNGRAVRGHLRRLLDRRHQRARAWGGAGRRR